MFDTALDFNYTNMQKNLNVIFCSGGRFFQMGFFMRRERLIILCSKQLECIEWIA